MSLGGKTFCQTVQRKGHDDAHFCTAFFTAPCQWDVQTSIDVSLPIYEREKKRKNQCGKNLQRSLEFLFRWKCNIFLSRVKVISCRMIKGCRKRSFEGPTLAFGPFMVLLHLWGFRSLQKPRQIRFLSLILLPLLKNVADCLQKKRNHFKNSQSESHS